MTHYLRLLPVALALAACARAADAPQAAPAAKPAAAAPRPKSGGVMSAPAGTTIAKPTGSTSAATRYVLAPGENELGFTFVQEGSDTEAVFKQFSVSFVYDETNPAAGSLDVKIQATSIDSGYGERDDGMRGDDLLDSAKFPTIEYHAKTIAKSAKGIEAVGKLTVRDKTRDLRIPLLIRKVDAGGKPGLEITGNAAVNRLDYGVGQGDWAATDTIKNELRLHWKVQLVPAP